MKQTFGKRSPSIALSLFLALAMVVGLCPAVGLAEAIEDAGPDGDGIAVVQDDGDIVSVQNGGDHTDHDEVTFTAWTNGTSLPSEQGSYYLTSDVTLPPQGSNRYWTVPDGVTNLCLNGYKITGGSNESQVIIIGSNSTLNLYDCQGGTTGITGGACGVCVIGGTLNMYGGAITGNNGGYGGYGGGVYVADGKFDMHDGTISDNKASSGGGVYVNTGTFAMSGGTISDNESTYGGGVCIFGNMYGYGALTMHGGTISGNTAKDSGGGVYVGGGTLTMDGGTISDNESTYGGGVYNYGTFELSGSPTITGNTAGSGSSKVANNVHLPEGRMITVVDALENTVPVGVTMEKLGVFTNSETTSYNDAGRFASDATGYAFGKNADGQLLLGTPFVVTFDANGHGTASAGQTVVSGNVVTEPADPAADGFVFGGWYTEAACENKWDFGKDTVEKTTTLYAKWTKKLAAVVAKAPEGRALTHTGSAQELVTAGKAEGGTMQYSLDGREYSEAIPKATDVGEYVVWYRAKGDENHLDSEAQKVTSTIAKKDEPTPTPAPAKPVKAGKPSTTAYPSKKRIVASWKAVKNATSYELSWRVTGGKWKTKTVKATSYTITGLKAGKLYDVRVRGVDGSAKGAWSTPARSWMKGASKVKAAIGKAKGSIKVTWKKDKSANKGYKVFVYAKKGGKPVATKTVSKSKASATIKGLKSGRKYFVRVCPLRAKSGATYAGALSGYRTAKAK